MNDALLQRLDAVVALLGTVLGALLAIAFLAWGANGLLLAGSGAFLFGIGAGALVQYSPPPTDEQTADASAHED